MRRAVVLVVTDTRRGGTPRRFAALARGAHAHGWRVLVVSVMAPGPVLAELAVDGIATASLDLATARDLPRALVRLRRLIRGHRADVVHSALWHANLLARIAAVRTGVPVINDHTSLDDERPRMRIAIDRLTGRLAHAHTAVAAAVAERVAARDQVPRDRIHVIRLGYDPAHWVPRGERDEVRERLGIPPSARVVGWTGRMQPVKQLDALVHAVGRLPGWWVLAVGDGPERGRLAAWAAEAGLDGRVVVPGEVEDPLPYLEACDVFCLPSRSEGLPGALLEAMASGLPVVSTRVGGVEELVVDGEDGRLVDDVSPAALAEAIEAAAGMDRVVPSPALAERFSLDAMVDAYTRLWLRVAGPVRILRVIARLNIGGPAHHVTILSRGLDAGGYQTLLAIGSVGPGEGSYDDLARRAGAGVARVPSLGPELRPLADVRALVRLVRLVRRFDPHIVHTHTAKAGFLGRLAALAARRPRPFIVHTYHGHVLSGYFGPLRTSAYRAAERRLARVSDRLVAVSERTRDELLRLGIGSRGRWRVVPLGLELDRFLETSRDAGGRFRAGLGAAPGDVVVTYVGRLVPIKRLDVLLHAFAAARARQGLRLAVVGDGPNRPELERLAAKLSLGERVRFLGFRDGVEEIAAGTDIAVMSSDNEGTPVWLIEAAAAGVPLLGTDVGGVADVVAPGTGRVVPAGDAVGLARELTSMAADPKGRSEMGRAARRHVRERFHAARLVADVDRLYREIPG
jgi:glycosyltransferase involved in cell wall biosynthesis